MSESTSAHAPSAATEHKPAGAGILLALVPWVLFTLVAEHGTLKAGAIVAGLAAVGVCLYSARTGQRPKLIELAAVGTFVAFTVVAFLADPTVSHWLTRYARAIASAVLAALVFASLLAVPFTEEYARESVPRELWSSPRFIAVNRQLTLMWGAIFTVMTASHVIAGAVNEHRTNVIFNWVIPIALVLWGTRQSHAGAGAPLRRAN